MISIIDHVDDHLSTVAQEYRMLSEWPELAALIRKTATNNVYLRIPNDIAVSINASAHITGAALIAIACLQLSLAIIDDVLDNESIGFHVDYGVGAAANAGYVLQTVGQHALLHCMVPCPQRVAALELYQATTLTVALAQNVDLHPCLSESRYWEICHAKSGAFFGFVMAICATLAGWEPGSDLLYKLGVLYGEIVQIQDDLQDALEIPATSDWFGGGGSLPLVFASTVPHAERDRFASLRKQARDLHQLREAQNILFRSGAVSYGLHQIMCRHQQATELIAQLAEANRPSLEHIFHELILPARTILACVEARPAHAHRC